MKFPSRVCAFAFEKWEKTLLLCVYFLVVFLFVCLLILLFIYFGGVSYVLFA